MWPFAYCAVFDPTSSRSSRRLETSNRLDDFHRRHNGPGVIRDVDIERSVHFLIRVIRCCVFHDGHVIAELRGIANGRFHTGMRYQSNDDKLMDAMLLELQIQIRVGEAAGTPMLRGDDLAWPGREFGSDLAAPSAVREAFAPPGSILDGRNVLPSLVVAWTVPVMHRKEDPQSGASRGVQDPQHMGHAVSCFCDRSNARPYLAAFRDEVVVGIDHNKSSELPIVGHVRHGT